MNLKQRYPKENVEMIIWQNLWASTCKSLLPLIKNFPKEKKTCQLLEFQYVVEDQTFNPWLMNISTNVKLMSTGVLYLDIMQLCLVDKVFDNLKAKLHDMKIEKPKKAESSFYKEVAHSKSPDAKMDSTIKFQKFVKERKTKSKNQRLKEKVDGIITATKTIRLNKSSNKRQKY